jgi:hypothetical protein
MNIESKDDLSDPAKTLKCLAETHLQIINSWISNADMKAGLLLATIGILLGFFSTYLVGPCSIFQLDLRHVIMVISGTYASFRLLWAAWACLRALGPILSLGELRVSYSRRQKLLEEREKILSSTAGRSLLHFSGIADLSLHDFVQHYQILANPHEASLHLIEQIHTNSIIAQRKFKLIHSAASSILQGILAAALAVAISLLAY